MVVVKKEKQEEGETMDILARLSHMNDGEEEELQRPTPLDPEYWRGITHSFHEAPIHHHFDPYAVAHTQHYGTVHQAQPGYPAYSAAGYHPSMTTTIHRPMTAPSMSYGYGVARPMGSSMVHFDTQPLPISPIAHTHSNASYGARPMTGSSSEWGLMGINSGFGGPAPVINTQSLKTDIRDGFVRAQAFVDLLSLLRAYDPTMSGMIPLHALQDAFATVGVILPSHVLQGVLQQFAFNGNDMIDYGGLVRFLEIDNHELDQIRVLIAARRQNYQDRVPDISQMFSQLDGMRNGFIARSSFVAILRECGVILPEGTLHFLLMQLAKPFDSMSICYTRFLDLVGVSGGLSPVRSQAFPSRSPWSDPSPYRNEGYATAYEPPFATPAVQGRASFADRPASSFETPLPRHGWICRVCAHQQIEEWVTHCEVCETSKPRSGKYGFLKCEHCKFDNNYDMEDCEMCGRPLVMGGRRKSREKQRRKHKRKHRWSHSSSSRSSSSKSSSASSDRSRRSSRSRSSRSGTKSPRYPHFRRGQEVQAVPRGERDYEIGVIARVHSDRTYDIDFDSGKTEKRISERYVQEISRARIVQPHDKKPQKKDQTDDVDEEKPGFREGERIEAQFNGGERFFPGMIQRRRSDGTYDILYDDNEVEMKVKEKYVRRLKPKSPTKAASPAKQSTPRHGDTDSSSSEASFVKGQKVEVKLKGSSGFLKGSIFRTHIDGTYDVELDTGELEKNIPASSIRTRPSSPLKKPTIQSDDEPARPKRPTSTPRKPTTLDSSSDASSSNAKKYREGQRVEARFKGGDRFFSGVISRCRLNGTFDIEYDDGEKETGIKSELIRPKESASPLKKQAISTDTSESDVRAKPKLTVGQNVEARYKGKDKYYPGVVARVRLGGKYDIDYDDGEKEMGVLASLVRPRSSSPTKAKPITSSEDEPAQKMFKVGQPVEARYRGNDQFYPGVIGRVRNNGTYDIEYDDGEKETEVKTNLIRLKSAKPQDVKPKVSSTAQSDSNDDNRKTAKKFREGEKVEAQYKGKSKFYPGVISRCRLNGTYDIDYDDGEKETGVAAELIRSREASSPSKKKPADSSEDDARTAKKFREGEKVEAQYKGKSKFYPGVISRCRLNGTYDIDYDDGEKETGVAAELIRSLEKKSSKDDDDRKTAKKFREGEKVEAQYKGKSKFYPGVISRCRLNGTYDIDYDDGEKETGVAAELIRSREASSPSKKKPADSSEDDARTAKKFREGEKVEAQYKGKSKFYPGVISRCRLNGTYDIDYDDGEKETGVAAELIRSLEKKSSKDDDDRKTAKKFREGEKVEAQYKGKSKFYPGVISRCRLNGTYDIDYDDGEKETGVAAELIRSREASSPSKKKPADSSEDDARTAKKFREGEKVEAQYKGKSKFYPGVISRCRLNGTYDIDYDDGEKETGVAAELIRSLEKKSSKDDDDRKTAKKFREGEKVEAQYKGKSKFYPGVISRCRLNGTYDIDYDDGEKETGVAAELIRSREASSPSKKKPADSSEDDARTAKKFREGEKVEAQYKGKSKFYPGVISRCRLNGTYDIDYDDGEKETGVAAELIRSLEKKSSKDDDDRKTAKKFREGEKVEAQYKGKSKFYPGVISRCRLNGTYDIDYDDGEKETGVAAELIRSREASSPSKKKPADSSEDDARTAKKFREGEKVEAQYKGKSKFYPGVISRCRLNGTYDIDYDDGEKETGVAAELIRSLEKKSSKDDDDRKTAKKFREGEKVEAQYKGKSKFYPGVISRCRLNGTYDIDYDDGEKETGVAAELIRSREASSPSKKKPADSSEDDARTAKKFREGEKVEAQYKGKSKFYPGVISRCRLNGTYDIDYDDGEKETGVAAELIRSLEKKSSKDDDDRKTAKKFREGEKVEAQYKGKSKFYPGVISRCRLNGTYDIDYDDGEKETGVAAELIRSREASSPSKKKPADSSEDDARTAKKFREGEKVEAQYKGKSKFYPGVISRCRLNGTYDIDYDDGEKETGVAAELIRSLEKKSSKDDDDRKTAKKFREGEKVEAQYKGKSKFYPGVISRCRLNGTYDIDYDDGEKETGVAAELIRSREASSPSKKKPADSSEDDARTAKKFREGEKVEAQYKGKSKFYPGVISRCRLNGTYDIDYDDGEKETGVAAELIRSLEKKSSKDDDDRKTAKKFREGEKVEAQYKGKSKFYPGVISRCRLNGTYDIDYDDGEKETGVAAELIRSREASSPSKKKPADSSEDDARTAKKFREGEKVEAQYKGKSKFYPGVISRCRLNGTYDIDYDDGEKETGVAAELIRSLEKKSSKDDDDRKTAKKFREGEKVEAQYKGKSKFYPGVISRCRLNGTYDIDYDDGEKETGVAAELIRSREASSPSKKKPADSSEDDARTAKKFREGEKVEAQYKGKSKFYPGVISRCRLNGTYDIDYDDGEKETGVAAELIRSLEKKSSKDDDDRKTAKKFREGEKVEAQYKGKSKFYPGVISRCRLNGTYDIDYDDGEKETGVAAELIRSREASSPSKKKPADSSEDDARTAKKFREGEKVEAQYKGKSKFYPGVISRCRLNGTYDIDYDDGEKETGVAAELIRSLEKKSSKDDDDRKTAKKFREGEKVEAQYKGKSKFYPGVISRCRLNGTYDIDYDDGEKETGVAAELIRSREASSPSKKKPADSSEDDARTAKKFREGEKVEAQYKGKSKFYPGVISRCRLNGTYDIDYDDGEKETGVAAELIRSLEKKSSKDDDDRKTAKKFREGEKVEAQYKGKSKFYPGVISRCRLNGTYDIDYDDGEKETGVAAELIRSREASSPSKKKPADSSEDDARTAKKFREGEKVEAQYKGKSKFYPGVISRCRLNGTYDIDYDDGEKETGVAAELIRSLEKKSSKDDDDRKTAKKFREGEKVEAQYKGKSKFYPGVISRCRLNGTYDIDYDDGEKETGVAAELIRSREASSPSKKKPADSSEDDARTAKKFREGEKVEAQYKGKSKFYPGVISRCRLNGTYDIDYDDGEKETGVAAELIRSLEKKSSSPSKSRDDVDRKLAGGFDGCVTFRVGARVEALFQGKDKYFKGTVSRANADGTYGIEYDDGDKENRVSPRNIRPLKTPNFSATAEFSSARPSRPSASGGARRRSGNSSD